MDRRPTDWLYPHIRVTCRGDRNLNVFGESALETLPTQVWDLLSPICCHKTLTSKYKYRRHGGHTENKTIRFAICLRCGWTEHRFVDSRTFEWKDGFPKFDLCWTLKVGDRKLNNVKTFSKTTEQNELKLGTHLLIKWAPTFARYVQLWLQIRWA